MVENARVSCLPSFVSVWCFSPCIHAFGGLRVLGFDRLSVSSFPSIDLPDALMRHLLTWTFLDLSSLLPFLRRVSHPSWFPFPFLPMGLVSKRRGSGRSDGHVIQSLLSHPIPFRWDGGWDRCSLDLLPFDEGVDQVRLLRHVNVTLHRWRWKIHPHETRAAKQTRRKRRRLSIERDKDNQGRTRRKRRRRSKRTKKKKRNGDGNGGYTLQTQRNTRGRWRSLQGWRTSVPVPAHEA